MESRLPTKKIEEYLSRIETLERQFVELTQSEAQARKEMELHFLQIVTSQREEITRLCSLINSERRDRRRRRINAIKQLESE